METSFQGIYVPPIAGTLRLQNVFTMSPNRCLGCLRSIHLPDHEMMRVAVQSILKGFQANIYISFNSARGREGGLAPALIK